MITYFLGHLIATSLWAILWPLNSAYILKVWSNFSLLGLLLCAQWLYPTEVTEFPQPIHPPHIRITGLEDAFHLACFHLITYSFKGQLVSHIPHKLPNSTNTCLICTWRISTDLPSLMNNKFPIWAPSALSLMTFPLLGKRGSVHLRIPVFIFFLSWLDLKSINGEKKMTYQSSDSKAIMVYE